MNDRLVDLAIRLLEALLIAIISRLFAAAIAEKKSRPTPVLKGSSVSDDPERRGGVMDAARPLRYGRRSTDRELK